MKSVFVSCPFCGERLNLYQCIICSRYGKSVSLANGINNRLSKAFQMIASSQHGDGLNLLEEANTKDNQNGKIYFAMLLCDLTVNSASKFTKLGFGFTRSPNYQHAFIQYYFNKMF